MRRGTKRSRTSLANEKQLATVDEAFHNSVYVGMTGLTVEQRFENHKNGQKSAWVVRKYGLRLMPELFGFLNPMPFEAAAQMEKDLAEDLRADGYTVTGGT